VRRRHPFAYTYSNGFSGRKPDSYGHSDSYRNT
jgi:hypothetical protein